MERKKFPHGAKDWKRFDSSNKAIALKVPLLLNNSEG